MNTLIIMSASSALLILSGTILTFFPEELIRSFEMTMEPASVFLLQILGALYFAFGMLNWMNRTSVIGGIYNRPVAIANSAHFLIAGIALLKGLIAYPNLPPFIWLGTSIYLVFAALFSFILFNHPVRRTT